MGLDDVRPATYGEHRIYYGRKTCDGTLKALECFQGVWYGFVPNKNLNPCCCCTWWTYFFIISPVVIICAIFAFVGGAVWDLLSLIWLVITCNSCNSCSCFCEKVEIEQQQAIVCDKNCFDCDCDC